MGAVSVDVGETAMFRFGCASIYIYIFPQEKIKSEHPKSR